MSTQTCDDLGPAGARGHAVVNACRACGRSDLDRVLDLGAVPATDHFPAASVPLCPSEAAHPLAMDLCTRCGLVQLADDDTVNAEPRGVESQVLRDQAEDAVQRVAAAGWLTGTTVDEFGSPHGGSWLSLLAGRGFTPTAGPADVVVDCFGITHEPHQRAAFAERAAATAPDGVLLLQYHALAAMISHRQWSALSHGHYGYYSMPALTRLFADAGMRAVAAWHFDLYGGTVLVAAVHQDSARDRVPDAEISRLLIVESVLTEPAAVASLQSAADAHVSRLRSYLEVQRAAGRRVYAYGATPRAVALFSRAGLRHRLLAAVADPAPAKQGRRIPGTDIPVISPKTLVAAAPDVVVLTVSELLPEVSVRLPELAGRWVTDDWIATQTARRARCAGSAR